MKKTDMTTFENELRKIFGNNAVFEETRFVGRSCYGKIRDLLRVRAEFTELSSKDEYDALKVSLINRNEGVIDTAILRFHEILGVKSVSNPNFKDGITPHMWVYNGILEWYCYKPDSADYKELADAVNNYLEIFREPVQEMNSGMGQNMG